MPIPSSCVNQISAPAEETIDPRWAMNFAAAIDDFNPRLYATDQGPLQVHPLYLGYTEWEATKQVMASVPLTDAERMRGVAAGIVQTMHQPLHTGMHISTTARITALYRHSAGAFMEKTIETTSGGEPVCTTLFRSVMRGVEVDGPDVAGVAALQRTPFDGAPTLRERIVLHPNACHVFSECARAYNAFHTDISVARKAGLSGLILHGAATMAHAVSVLTKHFAEGDMTRIRRIAGDYRAMVFVPGAIEVQAGAAVAGPLGLHVPFQVLTDDGKPAVAGGELVLGA